MAIETSKSHLASSIKTTRIVINEKGEQLKTFDRKEKGWIVPIALGFQGISDLSMI
jgi:hypothetical protein